MRRALRAQNRKHLEQAIQLPFPAIRLNEFAVMPVRDQAHRTLLPRKKFRDRRGNRDDVLFRQRRQAQRLGLADPQLTQVARFERVRPPTPSLDGVFHVEKNPHIRRWVKLEFLDDQAIHPRGRTPVNPIERITWRVLARARHVRRRVMCALLHRIAAGELTNQVGERRQINRRGLDGDHPRRVRHPAMKNEQAKWIAGRNRDRSERKDAAPVTQRANAPTPSCARSQRVQHTADMMRGQFRFIVDFDPDFRHAPGIVDKKTFFSERADLGARRDDAAFEAKREHTVRRPHKGKEDERKREVGKPEKNVAPGLIGEEGQREPDEKERPIAHADRERAVRQRDPNRLANAAHYRAK